MRIVAGLLPKVTLMPQHSNVYEQAVWPGSEGVIDSVPTLCKLLKNQAGESQCLEVNLGIAVVVILTNFENDASAV